MHFKIIFEEEPNYEISAFLDISEGSKWNLNVKELSFVYQIGAYLE